MKLLIYIFFFLCFFPYIDIIRIGTDTQPNALIASIILLITMRKKMVNLPIIIFWLLFILAILLVPTSNLSGIETAKNVLNYLSVPLLCFAAYNMYLKSSFELSFKIFFLVIMTYFFVGFVQMYYDPDFMTFLLNQGARGVMLGGRGVVSLSPEPAFYGSLCLFFCVFSLVQYPLKYNLFSLPILIFQVVFFSQSATSILVLIIAALIFMGLQIMRFRLKYVLAGVIILLVANVIYQKMVDNLESSRASILINEIRNNPLLIAQLDVSAGVRITSSISPFLAAKHNAFLPMGMGNYKSFISGLYKSGEYPKLLNKHIVLEIGRLGGGINMVLFHLGFLGLLFPIAIYLSFKDLLYKNKELFGFILFVVLLFTQIQLMQSMIGLILASVLYLSRKKRLNQILYAESEV